MHTSDWRGIDDLDPSRHVGKGTLFMLRSAVTEVLQKRPMGARACERLQSILSLSLQNRLSTPGIGPESADAGCGVLGEKGGL